MESDYSEPFVAEFYDYVVPYVQRQDLAFYVDMAREARGPVLEVACGTGRVLIPTARAGIDIMGLDSSPPMLDACRRKLAEEPETVQSRVLGLVPGDMRSFDLQRTFNLVTMPFRPFQHLLTVDDQMACLRAIRSHLAPGGRVILDLFNPSLHMLVDEALTAEHGDEPVFTMPDGRKVVRRARFTERNWCAQVTNNDLIYHVTHPDGRQERFVHSFYMRYLFRFEVEHLLVRTGFVVEQVYGDYDRSPFGAKYPGELIVVARLG